MAPSPPPKTDSSSPPASSPTPTSSKLSTPPRRQAEPWPETPTSILAMFISNLYTMTVFLSANTILIICSSLLQEIWNRNFGRSESPAIWILASVASVMVFSLMTLIMWSDGTSSGQNPSLLLSTAWAFSIVGAVFGGVVVTALSTEWTVGLIGIGGAQV